MPGLPPRPYTIEEYTRTVCPLCAAQGPLRADQPGTFVDGMLVSHDGAIWMRRFCPRHGETESLYEEDADIWRDRFGWSTPTLSVKPDREDNFGGFPEGYRNGLPASHGQHTCLLLLNVTESCNFSCPTCYADANAPGEPALRDPSLADLLHTVDTMIAREAGKVSVVMLSGGEPTVRKDLEDLLCNLFERNVTRVMINTNGRRIARDDKFLKFLQRHRDRIEVYLQYDGLRPSTHLALRGEDLTLEKQTALRRLDSAGVFSTLVATVEQGVNKDEVGDLLLMALEVPRCAGLAIQPVFGSGRRPQEEFIDGDSDAINESLSPGSLRSPTSLAEERGLASSGSHRRVTPTGVLRRLHDQTQGLVQADDFIPLPCSHRDCCDITYLLKTRPEGWRSLPKLIGRDELKRWIHLVSNTISFETASDAIKGMVTSGALQRVFSEQQKIGALQLVRDIAAMCDCVPGLADLLHPAGTLDSLAEKTFRVTVKMFMDAHTFHEHRIRQCCVHVGSFEEDPRRTSFCWRWLFEDSTDFPGYEGLAKLPMVSR